MSRKIFFTLFFLGVLFGIFNDNFLNEEIVFAKITETRKKCNSPSRPSYILCFKNNLEKEIEKQGVAPFMRALEKIYEPGQTENPGGISVCHDTSHAIGQVGALKSGLEKTLASCTNICASGCYHGAVEGFIASGEDLILKLPTLCKFETNDSKSQACLHGLGHGVADLAGLDLVKALELCDLVSEEGRRFCGAGVIMELYEPSSFDHALLSFPEDIPAFCNGLWEPYRMVCHITAGSHEWARNRNEEEVIGVCGRVPQEYKRECIETLGQNLYFFYQANAPKMLTFCGKFDGEDRSSCLSGATQASATTPLTTYGLGFCKDLPKEDKGNCYRIIGQKSGELYGEQKKKDICSQAEEGYRAICNGS